MGVENIEILKNTRVLGSNLSYLAGAPAHTQRGENFVYMAEAVKIMAKFGRAATLLDVGANVGKTTFPTLALPLGHRVLAVEPAAANVALLCRGAALNGWARGARLTLVQGALSDRGGRARILVPAGRGGNAALPAAAAAANARAPAVAWTVRTLRGDALLTVTGMAPDVIKIDAQGRELRVLRGLREYLRKAPNALVIAGGGRGLMRRSGADPRDIWELMVNELGYDAYGSGAKFEVVKGALSIHGVKPLSEKHWPPKAATDVYFLRPVAAKQ